MRALELYEYRKITVKTIFRAPKRIHYFVAHISKFSIMISKFKPIRKELEEYINKDYICATTVTADCCWLFHQFNYEKI